MHDKLVFRANDREKAEFQFVSLVRDKKWVLELLSIKRLLTVDNDLFLLRDFFAWSS